jgi:hypothetical protein
MAGRAVFHQTADLFLYSYEADFFHGLLKKYEKKLARPFNFTFLYIDDVLTLNNCKFCDFVVLEIKNNTNTARSVSFLDIHPEIDNGRLFQFPHCELSIYI